MSHILVVDDNDEFRSTILQLLQLSGHSAAGASDGQVALRTLAQRQPDLVLLDMMMPVKEGYETLLEIRKLHPTLPVIAMTGGMPALAPNVLLRGAHHFGAQRLLEKPFRHEVLLKMISEVLEESGGGQQAGEPGSGPEPGKTEQVTRDEKSH